MPWSLPLIIFTAAKSRAEFDLSNKWFCKWSGKLVSKADEGSLIKLRNNESIPPACLLIFDQKSKVLLKLQKYYY